MDVVDVILRDGSTLRLRPPARADADALLDFFRALSEQSLYLRFHGFPSLGPELVEQVARPRLGRARRAARLARRGRHASGSSRSRTTCGCATRPPPRPPSPSPTTTSGAGSARGSSSSSPRARPQHGIERFVAEVLPENRHDARRLRGARLRADARARRRRGRGRVPDRADRALSRRASTSATTSPSTASLRPFFEPRTRRRDRRLGAAAARSAASSSATSSTADFTGAAYPVNRDGEPVAGVRGYRSIEEIPDPVDLAVICVPGERVLEAAEEALRTRRRARSVVISAGFAEIGQRGRRAAGAAARARPRARRAARSGRTASGSPSPAPSLNATFAPRALAAGQHRLLVAERRARARAARGGRDARPRPLGVRLDREQGRRLVERPARVVGGRRGDRRRPALPRVVRQPAQVRRASRGASRGASRSSR